MNGNPQCEEGYVMIANELCEALCRTRIPGEARQIFDVILRKTYGYKKKEDYISYTQFSHFTGLNRPGVNRSLKKLKLMNVIVIKKDNNTTNKYSINKQFLTWNKLSKRITSHVNVSSLLPFCYICEYEESIHKHHIKTIQDGGNNKVVNIINLCPNCHSLVHRGNYSQKELRSIKDNRENGNKKDNGKNKKVNKSLSNTLPTKDNKETIKEKRYSVEFIEIINHLNETIKASYKQNSDSTRSLIKARLDDGFTVADFRIVHEKKFAEWGQPPTNGEKDMRQFLRPSTLYRKSHFEEYLNQTIEKDDYFSRLLGRPV